MTFARVLAPAAALTLLLFLGQAQAQSQAPAPAPAPQKGGLKTVKDKVSYSIGLNIGRDFKSKGIDVDPAMLAQGMRDAMNGAKPKLTDEEMQAVLTAYQNELREAQVKRMQAVADKNKKEGDDFLAKNKTLAGVVTTPSGLQYKVIKEGTGKSPTLGDTVVANYRGTLLNGKEFDSSYKRGQPASFPVTGVIPGWTEILQKMKVGAKYMVYIPPNLAYGDRSVGQDIGPDSTLVFEIELLDVKQE